jgi:hypothetical protein
MRQVQGAGVFSSVLCNLLFIRLSAGYRHGPSYSWISSHSPFHANQSKDIRSRSSCSWRDGMCLRDFFSNGADSRCKGPLITRTHPCLVSTLPMCLNIGWQSLWPRGISTRQRQESVRRMQYSLRALSLSSTFSSTLSVDILQAIDSFVMRAFSNTEALSLREIDVALFLHGRG